MHNASNLPWTFRKICLVFLLVFIPLVSLMAGLLYLFYVLEVSSHHQITMDRQQQVVELNARLASDSLQSVISDLQLLRKQNELHEHLSGMPHALEKMSTEYQVFSRIKGVFDQVRMIDESGQEVLRINHSDDQHVKVADHQLQDKSDRYYVKDTLSLPQGSVFISPLDLNVEKGQVEVPAKPMIRFGSPVYDSDGSLRGAILLNYRAQVMLDRLREVNQPVLGDTMVLNNQGYWLLSPERDNEWGFMYEDKQNLRFGVFFPGEWSQIISQEAGQIRSDRGLFTYTTVYPQRLVQASSETAANHQNDAASIAGERTDAWKILSYIPARELGGYAQEVSSRLLGLGVTFALLAIVGSTLLTAGLVRRQHYLHQLEALAHFDSLTGLPNRALYFDRLEQALSRAERYQRPLAQLYVDIDNFKHINDGFGHQAGDLALRVVAKRLEQAIRKSDTLARLAEMSLLFCYAKSGIARGVSMLLRKS